MSPLSIIICILGLGILAAVHEIGHFIVARLLKIKVYELSGKNELMMYVILPFLSAHLRSS